MLIILLIFLNYNLLREQISCNLIEFSLELLLYKLIICCCCIWLLGLILFLNFLFSHLLFSLHFLSFLNQMIFYLSTSFTHHLFTLLWYLWLECLHWCIHFQWLWTCHSALYIRCLLCPSLACHFLIYPCCTHSFLFPISHYSLILLHQLLLLHL